MFWFGFLLGPAPFFVASLFCFVAKRKSGWGICGSFLVAFFVLFCLICIVFSDDLPEFFGPHVSYTLLLLTAYAIVRTVPSAIGQIGGKKSQGECHAVKAALCDLGDPGWGDPWFPH